ncbi:MAG: ATP-binding cassette domain-containing protein [Bacilli bacterium]|nr:ATP-binding cassette domain-containing protein [Bacilli bacterium]
MLELKNIKKSYKTGDFVQHALKGVDLSFRKNEFVAILGPSGSGKTTLLNIIGGLDRYDSGDLVINNRSTKKFKDKNWDSYRNNCIGFIFQSYNLISHISVLKNVEMSITLSGYSKSRRKNMAIKALERVGLKDHINKKPNQLSGGQMQRVAIARALVNNPDIILADEPTGALDTKTSKQIMELIKEVASDKLVIMVTHNPDLAKEYANRIIEFKDGEILSDSNPIKEDKKDGENISIKKTKMSYLNAIGLSFNNLRTKKGRTILTAFASSIGIIGISLILSLSNGFQKQIDQFERDTSDAMPVIVSSTKVSTERITNTMNNMSTKTDFKDGNELVIAKKEEKSKYNKLDDSFINYLKEMNQDYLSSLNISYFVNINMIQTDGNSYYSLDSLEKKSVMSMIASSVNKMSIPYKNFENNEISNILTEYYDLVAGKLPTSKEEIVLEIKEDNSINEVFAKALNVSENDKKVEDLLNKTIKVVLNNDYYMNYGEHFVPKKIDEELYNNENNIELKVVGVIKVKEDKKNVVSANNGIYYIDALQQYILDVNNESDIVVKQDEVDYNIMTGEKFDLSTEEGQKAKEQMLGYLGKKVSPSMFYLYPKDFNSKDKLTAYLDKYNKGKSEEDKIDYLDQADLITSISSGIMDGITAVLIAFSSISLIVSSIMIGIITYISVLERTKEIGILRSLGARKKDIRRVFNAETFIIGLSSGLLGIAISRLLLIPINILLKNITDLDNVAVMDIGHSIILIVISIMLTLIGGAIPSNLASKKDPVEALRTE